MDTPANNNVPSSSKVDKQGLINSVGLFIDAHVTLLAIELEEAKKFAKAYLVHTIILIIAIIFFLIFLSVAIITYFWESYRFTAILGLAGFYLIVFLINVVSLYRLNKQTELFVSCKEELVKDKEMFFHE